MDMLLPCLYCEYILLVGVTKSTLEKELGTKPDSLRHISTCNLNIFGKISALYHFLK